VTCIIRYKNRQQTSTIDLCIDNALTTTTASAHMTVTMADSTGMQTQQQQCVWSCHPPCLWSYCSLCHVNLYVLLLPTMYVPIHIHRPSGLPIVHAVPTMAVKVQLCGMTCV